MVRLKVNKMWNKQDIENIAWSEARAAYREMRINSLKNATASGTVIGLLGALGGCLVLSIGGVIGDIVCGTCFDALLFIMDNIFPAMKLGGIVFAVIGWILGHYGILKW